MIKIEPKHAYGKKVYIKKGFYRGYRAEVKSFKEITLKNQATQEEETYIQYGVKIDNIPLKDLPLGIYEVREDWLIPYRKYIIF